MHEYASTIINLPELIWENMQVLTKYSVYWSLLVASNLCTLVTV